MPLMNRIAGIDEVGRGCIVGPVMAAAVILNPARPIAGLTDSKKMTEKKRRLLADQIKASALCWAVARAETDSGTRIALVQTTDGGKTWTIIHPVIAP